MKNQNYIEFNNPCNLITIGIREQILHFFGVIRVCHSSGTGSANFSILNPLPSKHRPNLRNLEMKFAGKDWRKKKQKKWNLKRAVFEFFLENKSISRKSSRSWWLEFLGSSLLLFWFSYKSDNFLFCRKEFIKWLAIWEKIASFS